MVQRAQPAPKPSSAFLLILLQSVRVGIGRVRQLWSRRIVFVVGCSGFLISSPGAAVCSVCGLGRLS